MAGAGFKTFNTGDVLTASDVNTYLMQQTVMVFADSSARSTALGANVAEGMISYLKDTNAVEVYNGSAWVSSDDPNAIQNTIVDAKGDLISATAADTPARLAVGTDGQVLTADSSTATGLKWAAAAGGLTKISTNTFSSVAGVNIDDCFTSTYTDYLVIINNINAATNADDILMQLRYSTSTQTTDYYGSSYLVPYTGSNSTLQMSNASSFTLAQNIGSGAFASTGQIFISRAGNTSERTSWRGQLFDDGEAVASHFAGKVNTARTYTGLRFTGASSNISGTITIYGLAK